MDRGFFSSKTINMLKKLDQIYLMPATMNEGDEDLSCTFTLVILPKVGKCEGEDDDNNDPTSKYVVFATNIPLRDILWNIKRLPKDYRLRWGLESGYIDVEDLRARTTSKNHSLRLLYFYYALILYNAWLLANLILARRFNLLP